MPYTPDPTDPTVPLDGAGAGYAAAELRALKAYIQAGGIGSTTGYALAEEQGTAGVNGGTLTSGSWQKRILNTEVSDANNLITLSSGVIVLVAGTYRFRAEAQAYNCNAHQLRLQNTSDAVTLGTGISSLSSSAIATVMVSSAVGRFTIAATKNIEVQHRCQSTSAAGLGFASNFDLEVFARVEFWKE